MGIELFYAVGAGVLLLGLVWGANRYRDRTRAEKQAGDAKTRQLYKQRDE